MSSISVRQSFPDILFQMLQDSEDEGFSGVVCWLSGGTSFKVFEPKRFVLEVMPKYFRQTKYKSFVRQLNIYGFTRIQTGNKKGGYEHPFFNRRLPDLCNRIKATPRKKNCGSISFDSSVPLDVQDINAALRLLNKDPAQITKPLPITSTENSNFPFKLYKLLQDVEDSQQTHIVSWIDDGMAFQVHDPKAFMTDVTPFYFNFGKYESFRRQLKYWGFERGHHRRHFHKYFVKSTPSLCMRIKRQVKKKEIEQIGMDSKAKKSVVC